MLKLPEPDGRLLQEDLALLELINTQIRAHEKRITADSAKDNPPAHRLQSLVGMILQARGQLFPN